MLREAMKWKVSDFIDAQTSTWKAGKVRECFEWDSAKSILSVELPSSLDDDYIYWKHHPSGNYTVKTGYYRCSKDQGGEGVNLTLIDQGFVKILWRLNIQPKWKIFIWRLFHDAMAIKTNLARRGIHMDETCDFCGEEIEDCQHLFRLCCLAKDVWGNDPLTICSEFPGSDSMRVWIQHYIMLFYSEDGKRSARIPMFLATLWGLWKARNEEVFRNVGRSPGLVMALINKALQEHESFTYVTARETPLDTGTWDDPCFPPGVLPCSTWNK
ncbi:uncharacterized protein LOC110690272 [Chenopodium quinoa]|uniref:uncharacterized protein LOC110690272 n=1 Tax=Chenopodium quinoa TaxID=63459 RepID=UPI000B79678F|nr:uncharacterized protein LOC110690272 [Chenopodium quinoa]